MNMPLRNTTHLWLTRRIAHRVARSFFGNTTR